MTATPIQTDVAKRVPRPRTPSVVEPAARTVIYADASRRARTGSQVSVDAHRRGPARRPGRLAGAAAAPQHDVHFPMSMENGEYRIARPPRRADRPANRGSSSGSAQVSLYFFDPSAQILVPEPVFVPAGDQFATALVEGLLRGPGGRAWRGLAHFFPPGLTPASRCRSPTPGSPRSPQGRRGRRPRRPSS